MIDFHCHLDLYEDPQSVIQRSEELGIYVLAVTTTPLAWAGNLRLVSKCKRIRSAPGLHPELVRERHKEVELLCELIPESRYVGEVGIDGSLASKGSYGLQEKIFLQILRSCEGAGGRILSIHSRGAASGVLDLLRSETNLSIPILHWFTGSQTEVERAADGGCWFSVNPSMLRSKRGRELVSAMPRNRVLTETDGPFANIRGNALKPWDVQSAEELLASVWGTSRDETSRLLLRNLRELVKVESVVPGQAVNLNPNYQLANCERL